MFTQNDNKIELDKLKTIISSFDQITLSEMDNVKLMSRTDTKFVFNIELLPEILEKLKIHYKVLNVDGVNISDYQTLYYDTDDFLFYNQHQCGKANRCKVRYRTYVQSDLHFFEVKNKNNKEITTKKRINTVEEESLISEKSLNFYHDNAIVNDVDLKPKLWANYARVTLVNKTQPERLTLDLNLNFKNDTTTKFFSNIVIAELKQERKTRSVFVEVISSYFIREFSISKYCLGVANLYSNVKTNNLKAKLLTLKKISHEHC
jgi:hypothetical protein